MKSRETLIRLQKWQVDEVRRRLAELEVMRADFQAKMTELEATVADERRFGETSPIGAFAYPSFARAMTDRRLKLEESIRNIDQELAGTRERLAEAYRELKKIELLEENRKTRVRQTRVRRDQAELDEVALKVYQRRQAQGGA